MKKIKVGIIGFGLSGKHFHFPFLSNHQGYEIEAICTSQNHPHLTSTKVTKDPLELIHNNNIDLIINTAPNAFHYSYTKAALEQNKHVVVEKPFVNHSAEGEELIKLAAKHNKLLSVFHNRRYDADFLTIKKLIKNNRLGDIKYFESHFDRWRPKGNPANWRETQAPGAGILFDLGSHLIDQMLCLFGVPEAVTADICSQRNHSTTDDYFHLNFKYGQKRIILHSSSFTHTAPRFQIFGDKGCFVKFGLDPQESQLKNNLSPLDSAFGKEEKSQFGKFTNPDLNLSETITSETGQYMQFYHELYQKISLDQGELPVSPQEALKVIKIIEICFESARLERSLQIQL